MRNFQEIYDFCHQDNTWRSYFNVPEPDSIRNRRVYKYWYGDVRDGQCRTSTFLYSQSLRQLERFLGKDVQTDWYIHVSNTQLFPDTDSETCFALENSNYVIAHVRADGVVISFENLFTQNPFEQERIYFTARTHHSFTQQGIIAAVKGHIEKNLLFPSGRFRNLQLAFGISKKIFPDWYKKYRIRLHEQAEQEHLNIKSKYKEKNAWMSFEDAYDILAASGMFYDFCSDEYERKELTQEFANMYNFFT